MRISRLQVLAALAVMSPGACSNPAGGERDAEPCMDAALPCQYEPGEPDRCTGDWLTVCIEMCEPECGCYGAERVVSCAETCDHLVEYGDATGFTYDHCGTEATAQDGPGDCWCHDPNADRWARGDPFR